MKLCWCRLQAACTMTCKFGFPSGTTIGFPRELRLHSFPELRILNRFESICHRPWAWVPTWLWTFCWQKHRLLESCNKSPSRQESLSNLKRIFGEALHRIKCGETQSHQTTQRRWDVSFPDFWNPSHPIIYPSFHNHGSYGSFEGCYPFKNPAIFH